MKNVNARRYPGRWVTAFGWWTMITVAALLLSALMLSRRLG